MINPFPIHRDGPCCPGAQLGSRRPGGRQGFTLFEIAISLSLLTFGVVSVIMLIPSGIKAQQKARFELLAATQTLQMIEMFAGKSNSERCADFETPAPWEARPFCYSGTRWDLETRLTRWDSGVMAVPPEIARRLDSESDEIRTILDQGGSLYYADPRAVPGIDPHYINPGAPSEVLKLIFAVTGYAQNNAIPVLSDKAWPYRAAYPSPPRYAAFDSGRMVPPSLPAPFTSSLAGTTVACLEGWSTGRPDAQPPSDRDPLLATIFSKAVAYDAITSGNIPAAATRDSALKPVRDPLLVAVLAFCSDVFQSRIHNALGTLPVSGLGPSDEFKNYVLAPGITDFVALGQQYDDDFAALCRRAEVVPGEAYVLAKASVRAEIAQRVQCMRFMAFVMSTFYIHRTDTGEAEPDLSMVFPFRDCSPAPVLPVPVNDALSKDRLRYYHERCTRFAMRYAASFPYDWGAPRPLTRSIMMDYPLIEYDLFSAPRTGTTVGLAGVPVAMWKPVSAQTITSIGLPEIFPGTLTGNSFDNTRSPFQPMDTRGGGQPLWGDAAHFTLTKPFTPAERCRQLVFWSVDWQSYEDAETAPSAPLDASRAPLFGLDATNMRNDSDYNARNNPGWTPVDGLFLRNPERLLTFTGPVSALPTGTAVQSLMMTDWGTPDSGNGMGNLNILNGVYGADRNHNYVLDRGAQSRSVRLRANLVARFNFYDPRIPITLR